jgi:Kdo2-lipid IVA lauroyltransferase/acyltransferase
LKAKKGSWKDWLAYLSLRMAVCAIHSASLESCDRICRILASGLADWIPLRRKTLDANLLLVYGQLTSSQLSALRRQMWHHLLLMLCEIAHAPRKLHMTNWRDHLFMRDKDMTLEFLLSSRPTVIVTGHFGNFEVAGYAMGLMGTRSATVARDLDNPYINDFLIQFRSGTGQTILPKDGSSSAIAELLEQRGTLCILADQFAGPRGCWVDFFGHPTSCHKALALFVLSAQAQMLVIYARRLGRPLQFEIGCTGAIDPLSPRPNQPLGCLDSVEDLTKWYNEKLEEAIRLAPEQYWWLHRRWREVPPNVQKKLAAQKLRKQQASAGN